MLSTSNLSATRNPSDAPAFDLISFRKSEIDELIRLLGSTWELPCSTALIESGLFDLWDAFHGFEQVRGKHILDLGCGSERCLENRGVGYGQRLHDFEPWLCRACHKLGAEVTGVDFCGASACPFPVLQRDLRDPAALSDFASQSYDAINMRLLLSSPEMIYRRKVSALERGAMENNLRSERERLLKPGGVIINWDINIE